MTNNFDAMFDVATGSGSTEEVREVTIKMLSLNGGNTYTIETGTTIGEFKAMNGLDSTTNVVTDAGVVLRNDEVITGNLKLMVSTPKKNG